MDPSDDSTLVIVVDEVSGAEEGSDELADYYVQVLISSHNGERKMCHHNVYDLLRNS